MSRRNQPQGEYIKAPDIKCTKIDSGEHEGWWCAELGGLGITARTQDEAITQLKSFLCLDK